MKTFDDYFYRLIAANPSLANYDIKMTLTVRSFRAQLQKAWEDGRMGGSYKSLNDLFGCFNASQPTAPQ